MLLESLRPHWLLLLLFLLSQVLLLIGSWCTLWSLILLTLLTIINQQPIIVRICLDVLFSIRLLLLVVEVDLLLLLVLLLLLLLLMRIRLANLLLRIGLLMLLLLMFLALCSRARPLTKVELLMNVVSWRMMLMVVDIVVQERCHSHSLSWLPHIVHILLGEVLGVRLLQVLVLSRRGLRWMSLVLVWGGPSEVLLLLLVLLRVENVGETTHRVDGFEFHTVSYSHESAIGVFLYLGQLLALRYLPHSRTSRMLSLTKLLLHFLNWLLLLDLHLVLVFWLRLLLQLLLNGFRLLLEINSFVESLVQILNIQRLLLFTWL